MNINTSLLFVYMSFDSCYECVEFIGKQMESEQLCTPEYTKHMVSMLDLYPGVIVLEDGFALAHARPDQGVMKPGLLFMQLAKPLDFFNKNFEPVRFVVGMTAQTSEAHLKTLQQLVDLIENKQIQNQNFTSVDDMHKWLSSNINN